jgi:predicted nucleic-acid-binding protein
MFAIDTNVVVRILTGDDLKQTAAARDLLSAGQIWVAKTVLLETEWVLRSYYKFDSEMIREALTKLLGLKNVSAEDEESVASALALMAHGIEFADAIHLSSKPRGATFISFDRSFVRRARRAGVSGISDVPVKG